MPNKIAGFPSDPFGIILNRYPLNEVSVGQPASAFGLPGEPECGSMDQLGGIFANFQTTPDT